MLTLTEINLIAEATAKLILDQSDELLTTKSCAEMLGVTVGALHKRCASGTIPYHRKHGALYFSKKEVTSYYMKKEKSASRDS